MLKHLLFALSVTSALSMPSLAGAMTIADSVAHAVATHPQVKVSEAEKAGADNGVWEQRAAFFPTVSVNSQFGHMTANNETTRDNTGGESNSWSGDGTITVTESLFDGFGNLNRYRSAKDRFQSAEYDWQGTSEDVAIRTARAHLNLMRTKELVDLAAKFLSDVETRRKNISLMVKEGAADEAELLQAEEILMIAKNAKLGYEESFRQAEADYIEVSGGMPENAMEIGDPLWNAFLPATIDDAVAHGSKENPRILAAGKLSAAAAKQTAAEKASFAPRLDAEMSYTKQDQLDRLGGESTTAKAMLKLGWNFSTGGAQFARVERSRQQEVESAAKKQGVMRSVEREVRQKYASMIIVDEQFNLLTERLDSSKKILKNYTAQYEGGKQSNLQLIAANSKVFEAATSRTDAKYRQLFTRFELLNAIGVLRDSLGVSTTVEVNYKG